MSGRERKLTLIAALYRALEGARTVAVGAASPMPAAAALMRRKREGMRVVILHSRRHNPFTEGARELFDATGQGRIDAFFLGGVQIDGAANINLVGTGDYPRMERRFPGSFGSAYMYFATPKVILFREAHDPRSLVRKVDFISAPGPRDDGTWRRGGPVALITGRCVFSWDDARRRFRLETVHPGETVDGVRQATGFEFDLADEVGETQGPDPEMRADLEGEIAREVAAAYPDFAARVLAAA